MRVEDLKEWVSKHRYLWVLPVAAFCLSTLIATTELIQGAGSASRYIMSLWTGEEIPPPERWLSYEVIDCCAIQYPLGWTVINPKVSQETVLGKLLPPKGTEAENMGVEVVFGAGEVVDRDWFDSVVPEAEKPDIAWRDTARITRPDDRELIFGFQKKISEGGLWHRPDEKSETEWGPVDFLETDLTCDLNPDEKTRYSLPILTRIGEARTDLIMAINDSAVYGSEWHDLDQLYWKYVSCGAQSRAFPNVRRFCYDLFSRMNVGTAFCAERAPPE